MKLKVISVLIVILIVMSVPVYADVTFPAPPSDGMRYWVVYEMNGIKLITSNSPVTVNTLGDRIYANDEFKWYKYEENQWVYFNQGPSMNTGMGTIHASNHDIAYNDGSGFFFLRPKILFQTMKTTDFGTILRNFSAGLIPVIGCLILVISLLKGWAFLRTQLTH